jgi:hypothetical protein
MQHSLRFIPRFIGRRVLYISFSTSIQFLGLLRRNSRAFEGPILTLMPCPSMQPEFFNKVMF